MASGSTVPVESLILDRGAVLRPREVDATQLAVPVDNLVLQPGPRIEQARPSASGQEVPDRDDSAPTSLLGCGVPHLTAATRPAAQRGVEGCQCPRATLSAGQLHGLDGGDVAAT